jgi:hypothetical protein
VDGEYLPWLYDGNMLWLKKLRDVDYYDPEAINRLWTGVPPEPSPPDGFFLEEYASRRRENPSSHLD